MQIIFKVSLLSGQLLPKRHLNKVIIIIIIIIIIKSEKVLVCDSRINVTKVKTNLLMDLIKAFHIYGQHSDKLDRSPYRTAKKQLKYSKMRVKVLK